LFGWRQLPCTVVGDATRLRQILTNLLNNGIKFTDSGQVELKASSTEEGDNGVRLRCEVIDTGIGIEATAIKRMFAPFAQADASTTRRFGGTGLGLSITHSLVELMGGKIDATSTVAVGSTFWFEIPFRLAHSADTTSALRAAQWLIAVRVLVLVLVLVLVVDDSAVNREVAQWILQSRGAIVSTCSDGSAAVEQLRAGRELPDIVLMDVQMPVLDGNAATRLIRGELHLQTLPNVGLTAGALVSERQRALRAGMTDVVTKPFDPQVLIRKIRHLVEQTRIEPIPAAMLERERVVQITGLPPMQSMDAKVVQQMFGGNSPPFKAALSRMLQDYADFSPPISVSLDDPKARSQLQARVHTLRGSAGLMGATRVMRLAGGVETALTQHRSVEIVERLLARLRSAFAEMRAEAETWLAGQAERDVVVDVRTAPRTIASSADIDDLQALLDGQNLAALDKFILLSPSLRTLMGADSFGRLTAAVDKLDFPRAAQLLCESRGATAASS
jgi:CheY-like chemotaxis protein/HPt (histidine-containing phosphotransfer) domain-containing protein